MLRIGRVLVAALVASLIVTGLVVGAATRAHRDGLLGLLLGVGAGTAVGLGIGGPGYFRWRRRLRRLARATRALAQHDFDAALPPPADDELGELQRAWKRMRLSMEELTLGLREEVGRHRSILDGMAEGVALLHDGEIVAANPAFGQLIGAVGALEGKTTLGAAPLPELSAVIEESVRSDAEVVREILADPRMLRVAARPLGGPQQQTVVVLLDMTEARRVERLRRDFVANASHELRTPVAAILGAAETLAAGASEDPAARTSFVDILVRHSQRLTRLTADLLDLARLEGGYRPRVELVPVEEVVEGVALALGPRAGEKGIALTTAVERPPDDALVLICERAAVEQVLTNLIDNAIKYTPEGGRVSVAVRARAGWVELVVADTGPGISPEHLPRLFERFYRVDAARSRELGGTGLGLAIVKHLVAANGGEVHVESQVGQGTQFRIQLPGPTIDAQSSH